jgi:hypothetical protein
MRATWPRAKLEEAIAVLGKSQSLVALADAPLASGVSGVCAGEGEG